MYIMFLIYVGVGLIFAMRYYNKRLPWIVDEMESNTGFDEQSQIGEHEQDQDLNQDQDQEQNQDEELRQIEDLNKIKRQNRKRTFKPRTKKRLVIESVIVGIVFTILTPAIIGLLLFGACMFTLAI